MQQTGNALNMAIQGDGFFQITNPAGGNLYTRDGTFSLNSNNQLVTADGYLVNPARCPFPPTPRRSRSAPTAPSAP